MPKAIPSLFGHKTRRPTIYIPPSFAENDRDKLHQFMDRHNFATLVSKNTSELVASHLPLLLDTTVGPNGKLLGHFARANLHWKSAAGQEVLAIFHGPHAYISPSWMEARNVVPTWNYVAVHAYGSLRLLDERGQLSALLERLVQRHEAHRRQPWSTATPEPAFVDKLTDAVVGFEIEISRLEGKWKLSQNHPAERREQIANGLRDTGHAGDREIAELMSETISR